MDPKSLEEKHHFFYREAIHTFASTKKMGGQEFCDRYQHQLEHELEEMWTSFSKQNEVGFGCIQLGKKKHVFVSVIYLSFFFLFVPRLKTSSAPSELQPFSSW